jgi:peptidyl-tRNA hydrolase
LLPSADLANVVRPAAAVTPVSSVVSVADMRREAFSRLAQISIGQELQAKVVSQFKDGSHLVHIANTAARMNLPNNVNVGDDIFLKLLSKDPRPTFLLSERQTVAGQNPQNPTAAPQTRTPGNFQQVAGNAVVAQNVALPTQLTTSNPQAQPSVTTSLSNAGKLIDTLLQATQTGSLPNAINSSAPLSTNPALQTAVLANNLRQAIQLSGVFYESHLAQWVVGQRTLQDLQKEPQAKIKAQTHTASDILQANDPSTSQLGKIIHMQLTALEQHRLIWQGQAWPGQEMHWEIMQDATDEQDNPAQQGEADSWQSNVRFNFKHLGGVEAHIHLIAGQIHIRIQTNQETTAEELIAHSHLLRESMLAAGSPLDSLTVKHDG